MCARRRRGRLAGAVSRLRGGRVWLCRRAAACVGNRVALAAGFCRRAAAGVGCGRRRALALGRLAPTGAGGGRLLAMACGRRPPLMVLLGGCGRQRWRGAWCQLSRRAAAGVGGGVALAVDVAGGWLLVLTCGRLLTSFCDGGRLWRRAAAVWPPSAARRRRSRRVATGNGVGAALAADSSGTRLLLLVRGVAIGIGVGARRVLPGADVAFASGVGGCRLPALAAGWRLLATLAAGGCWHQRQGGALRRLCRRVTACVGRWLAPTADLDGERLLELVAGRCVRLAWGRIPPSALAATRLLAVAQGLLLASLMTAVYRRRWCGGGACHRRWRPTAGDDGQRLALVSGCAVGRPMLLARGVGARHGL